MDFAPLLRRIISAPLMRLAVLFTGCHSQPDIHPVQRLATLTIPSSNGFNIQQDSLCKKAVSQFGGHDYKAALAGINSLLASSQFASNSADHLFCCISRQSAAVRLIHVFLSDTSAGLVYDKQDPNNYCPIYTYGANDSHTDATGRTTICTPDTWERDTKTSYPDGTANIYADDQL